MNKTNKIIYGVVVLLIIAGGSFYGGMLYGKTQSPKLGAGNGNFQTRINRGGGGGFISGDIISKDASSITLKLQNSSSSKIIFYSDTTQINKYAAGTSNDLSAGTSISVAGTANSDGSVTAQSIQIRPAKPATAPSGNSPVQ